MMNRVYVIYDAPTTPSQDPDVGVALTWEGVMREAGVTGAYAALFYMFIVHPA
jgi:hypothetical protein